MSATLPLLIWPVVLAIVLPLARGAARRQAERDRVFLPANWTPRGRLYRDAARHLQEVR